jgi:hypothetical protein
VTEEAYRSGGSTRHPSLNCLMGKKPKSPRIPYFFETVAHNLSLNWGHDQSQPRYIGADDSPLTPGPSHNSTFFIVLAKEVDALAQGS